MWLDVRLIGNWKTTKKYPPKKLHEDWFETSNSIHRIPPNNFYIPFQTLIDLSARKIDRCGFKRHLQQFHSMWNLEFQFYELPEDEEITQSKVQNPKKNQLFKLRPVFFFRFYQ